MDPEALVRTITENPITWGISASVLAGVFGFFRPIMRVAHDEPEHAELLHAPTQSIDDEFDEFRVTRDERRRETRATPAELAQGLADGQRVAYVLIRHEIGAGLHATAQQGRER